MANSDHIRNIAIIAHVDHGKTTLVDGLLKQSHTFRENAAEMSENLIMDSGDQERERGITITAKTTAVEWQDYKINIIDTPGHADFSGEVERTLQMADGVLLVVDAAEGPMPQTKFVLSKALGLGLKPIVVINKIDKPARRIDEVENEISDLFLELATEDSQLNYPIYFAIAREGKSWASLPATVEEHADLTPIFEAIVTEIPAPTVDAYGPFQMLITALQYDNFLGKYSVGKIARGVAKVGASISLVVASGATTSPADSGVTTPASATETRNDGLEGEVRESSAPVAAKVTPAKIDKLFTYKGLAKVEVATASAGDIVAIVGASNANIGETLTAVDTPEALPTISVEPPTISVYLGPNTSPFKGKEGQFTTSRQISERLQRELETNVALKVEPSGIGFTVSGRGELHLSVLMESLRREGYEFEVGRPQVVLLNGEEPVEEVFVEVGAEFVGAIAQEFGARQAELLGQETTAQGTIRTQYKIATRGLIGLRNLLLTATKGTVIMNSLPAGYQPVGAKIASLRNGALIASETGASTAYALANAESRGEFFIPAAANVYAGQIVGLNNRHEDLEINVAKSKNLTNMRSKSSDGAIQLTPFTELSLEQSLDFINDDELLEITPENLRLRKKDLDPTMRTRANKN
jgi:GTP-binding protein